MQNCSVQLIPRIDVTNYRIEAHLIPEQHALGVGADITFVQTLHDLCLPLVSFFTEHAADSAISWLGALQPCLLIDRQKMNDHSLTVQPSLSRRTSKFLYSWAKAQVKKS